MAREEEIKEAAQKEMSKYPNFCITAPAFRMGAEWADSHPHWISVKDELPPTSDKDDESDDYLIVDSDGDMNVGYYNKMDELWFSCDGHILDATHWMPLPSIEHLKEKEL